MVSTSNELRIDRRETVMDFHGQPVVTTDNVTVTINGALYYQTVDPKNAVYEAENMSQAVEVLARTALRSVVGTMAPKPTSRTALIWSAVNTVSSAALPVPSIREPMVRWNG